MIWVSTAIQSPGFTSVDYNQTLNVLCPYMYNGPITTHLRSLGLGTNVVITPTLNGCSKISALPTAVNPLRYAYKFYFALTASQWASFYTSMASASTIKAGHVMCNSIMYFQTMAGVNSPAGTAPITSTSNPQWLANPAVCYQEVTSLANHL